MGRYTVVLSQDSVKTTLGRSAVGTGGINLAQNCNITFFCCCQGSHEAGKASAHNKHLVNQQELHLLKITKGILEQSSQVFHMLQA